MGDRRYRRLILGGVIVIGVFAVAWGMIAALAGRRPYSDNYYSARESAVEQSSRVVLDYLTGMLPEFPN
ncbi:MAG: hypothetical protein ACRD2N_25860 [Vicinamibacterales bacterium]